MIYWFRVPRFNPSCHPYAREGQAVVGPLLRGRSPTRSVAPKQHRGPALTPLITITRARTPPTTPRRYPASAQRNRSRQNSPRARLYPLFCPFRDRGPGCFFLMTRGPPRSTLFPATTPPRSRFNPSCHPYAREGQAVVGPLLRGRSPTRSVAPKQHRGPALTP